MRWKALGTASIGLALAVGIGPFAQKPNFTGSWVMGRARSFGMPGNTQQTMAVNHTSDQVEVLPRSRTEPILPKRKGRAE